MVEGKRGEERLREGGRGTKSPPPLSLYTSFLFCPYCGEGAVGLETVGEAGTSFLGRGEAGRLEMLPPFPSPPLYLHIFANNSSSSSLPWHLLSQTCEI